MNKTNNIVYATVNTEAYWHCFKIKWQEDLIQSIPCTTGTYEYSGAQPFGTYEYSGAQFFGKKFKKAFSIIIRHFFLHINKTYSYLLGPNEKKLHKHSSFTVVISFWP